MKPENLSPALDLAREVQELDHMFKIDRVDHRDFPTNILCNILNSEEGKENETLVYFLNEVRNNRINKLKALGVEV